MNIKKILSFFGLKKTFRITAQEQQLIEESIDTISILNDEVIDVDYDHDLEDPDQYFEELLLDIFDDARSNNPETKNYDLHHITFSTLESYKLLQSNHPDYKKVFFHFLIKKLTPTKKNVSTLLYTSHISDKSVTDNFKLSLVNLLLNSNLNLRDIDFITLINFWKHSYPFQFNIKYFLKHLKKYSEHSLLSDELAQTLSSFLLSNAITYLQLDEYMYNMEYN